MKPYALSFAFAALYFGAARLADVVFNAVWQSTDGNVILAVLGPVVMVILALNFVILAVCGIAELPPETNPWRAALKFRKRYSGYDLSGVYLAASAYVFMAVDGITGYLAAFGLLIVAGMEIRKTLRKETKRPCRDTTAIPNETT